jgi:hypothetical protein
MFTRALSGFIAVAALVLPLKAAAENAQLSPEVDPSFQNARGFDLALFAPSAPGFVVLGLSPRRAADPGAFRTFGFDVTNLSSGDGYDLGGALSFEPFWWGHNDLTLKQYQDETTGLERVFARTQVSLAASYGSGNKLSLYGFGVGAQAQLLDDQDERYDPHSYDCIRQAWQKLRAPLHQSADDAVFDYLTSHPDASAAELKAIRDAVLAKQGAPSAAAFETARNACRDLAELASLAKPSLIVGVGGKMRTKDADFGSWRGDGGSVWATYREPVFEDGLVSLDLFGRYSFSTTLNLFDKGPLGNAKGNEGILGLGLALERPWWKVDGAISYVAQDFEPAALGNVRFPEASISGAIRIKSGLWLQASVDDAFGGAENGKPSVGVNVKYDWSDLGL